MKSTWSSYVIIKYNVFIPTNVSLIFIQVMFGYHVKTCSFFEIAMSCNIAPKNVFNDS